MEKIVEPKKGNENNGSESNKSSQVQSNVLDAVNMISDIGNVNKQETDLVILKHKAIVNPLTGMEEQTLKTSNETINSFIKDFDKLLYSKCEFPAKSKIKDYQTFLKYLTPQDKSLLIYALSLSSFDQLGTINQTCVHCNEAFPVEIKPELLWNEDSAPASWDLSKDPFSYICTQSLMDGKLVFNLKLPTEEDRLTLMDFLENKIEQNMNEESAIFSTIDTVSFLTSSIIVNPGDDEKVLETNEEIYNFLQEIPLKIKDIIIEHLDLTIFDKYMPNLYQKTACTRCHKPNDIPINIETLFFRKSLLLLSEV